MRQIKPRFTKLDAVFLMLAGIFIIYLLYRAHAYFHYQWEWHTIPTYIMRYDNATGHWFLNLLGQGFITTLRLSLWSGLLAGIIGVIVGICRSSNSLLLRLLSRAYVEFIRNIPPLVLIFIFYFFLSSQLMPVLEIENHISHISPHVLNVISWLFASPELLSNFISGVLCLAMIESAYVAEIVRAGMEAIPKGQTEAAYALGMSSAQTLRHIVLPQALTKMLPAFAGQFISLIKDSSLISLISIQELTFSATELAVSSGRVFEVWLTVAALYFLLCWILARLFSYLEQRQHLR